MAPLLKDLAPRFSDGSNPSTKLSAGALYDLYDSYFAELADQPVTLLELGVSGGESLKTFASYFTKGRIIGVDIRDGGADFSDFSNIVFALGDQKDAKQLGAICERFAPAGIDIVIDDASHFGAWSLKSYNILFPHLKPGGFYVIEDWATGYWDDWRDGSRYQEFKIEDTDGLMSKRIPTHDFGMVGFVKHLVDEVSSSGIRPSRAAPLTRPRKLDLMHVHREIVVLRKAGFFPP